jgi:cytochrome c556
MKKQAGRLVMGTAVLGVAIGLMVVGSGGAAEDKADIPSSVQKIADALAKKDTDQAKKLAEQVAKNNELEDVMHLMSKRAGKAKVFGVGPKPGAIQPDGIEAKLTSMGKRALPQSQINKESAALTEMGYRIAAIAEVAHAKPPEKEDAKKKKKDWMEWSGNMQKIALELASAAKAKKPAEIKKFTAELNSTCNACHGVFRDE